VPVISGDEVLKLQFSVGPTTQSIAHIFPVAIGNSFFSLLLSSKQALNQER
jgi:hypothetical protein